MCLNDVLRFKLTTSFKHTPRYTSLSSKALDGIPRFAEIPDGHEVVFEFDRGSSLADDYFCQQEVNYFSGGQLPNVSITETITEVNGNTTQYRYTGVALSLTDGGSWKGDSIATQSIKGMAAFKVKVA